MTKKRCLYCEEFAFFQTNGCILCGIATTSTSLFKEEKQRDSLNEERVELNSIQESCLACTTANKKSGTHSFPAQISEYIMKKKPCLYCEEFGGLQMGNCLAYNIANDSILKSESDPLTAQCDNCMKSAKLTTNQSVGLPFEKQPYSFSHPTNIQVTSTNGWDPFWETDVSNPSAIRVAPDLFRQHGLQEHLDHIHKEMGAKEPSILPFFQPKYSRLNTIQQTMPVEEITARYYIFPGIRMLPVANRELKVSNGTVGGCFWYFQPEKNGKHFLWLGNNITEKGSEFYRPFTHSPNRRALPFSIIQEFYSHWHAKGVLPYVDPKTGYKVLPGTLIPVFLTNWHNVAPDIYLQNPQISPAEPMNPFNNQPIKVYIQSSRSQTANDIEAGTVFKWSVPIQADAKTQSIGDNRPDAALVRLTRPFTEIFPLDLPIQLSNISTKSYIQLLEQAHSMYKVLRNDQILSLSANGLYSMFYEMIQLSRARTKIQLSSFLFPPVQNWWSGTNSPIQVSNNRHIPPIWDKPYLMSDPDDLPVGTDVIKLSMSINSPRETSVGQGKIAYNCNLPYHFPANQTNVCFGKNSMLPSTFNHKHHRGFFVNPNGANNDDENSPGMSGSLVFQHSNNALCGLLSGTDLSNFTKGNWFVNHFFDVFRAFHGLLIPGPVTLSTSELLHLITKGELPDGCGVYEF